MRGSKAGTSLLLRLYRAGVVAAIAVMVHEQAGWLEAQRSPVISLRQARKYFRTATRLELRDVERGLYFATDARGETVGSLLTTSPFTDQVIGYSGPNNLLLALDGRGAIVGVELVRSGDTVEHVRKVRDDARFLRSFIGWKPGEEPPPATIQGVSGATLTSLAVVESVQRRLAGSAPSLRFPDPITLAEVREFFPAAARLVPDGSQWQVLDGPGRLLGRVARTSPMADNVAGYRGPTECLVQLSADGKTILGIRLRKSYDTDSYVDQIRKAQAFLNRFVGRSLEDVAQFGFPRQAIEGVGGATLTARAVGEGMKRRFASELKMRGVLRQEWRPKPRDWALAGVLAGSMVLAFSSWRGHRWVRRGWQLLLVIYLGAISHDLLSLAVFGGWAAHGLAFRAAPGLVLLAALALLAPWATRRQLYCHQICPHGAAQQLLGGLSGKRWSPSGAWVSWLERLPTALLGAALVLALAGFSSQLPALEAFDAWVWRVAGASTLVLAVAGLLASLVIPQAYCRFGCPTGALLSFVRSTGSVDRWGRRDWAGLCFVVAGLATIQTVRGWPRTEIIPEPLLLSGPTMGTTWSVKIRDEVADAVLLQDAIAEQFEWAESLTSHWMTNTDLSVFNRTRETNAMPVPWPVLTLARWASEISRETDGAYDITVGPMVRRWGFGPDGPRTNPPSEEAIAALRPAVGWRQLEIQDGMLRKAHPALEVDLSSIAPGWAIDQVTGYLDRRGFTNFLVESGGELRARGTWTIAIEHPTRVCTLTNEAIGTSGTYRHNFRTGGRVYSHLIDPHTGRPITHRTVSVSVRHPDCARADAWAAALNVLGAAAGLPLAERLGLAAQFVTEEIEGQPRVQTTTPWRGP